MGICLRGKMTDAGILPRQAVADGQAATPPTQDVAVVAPQLADMAIGDPALDVTPTPEALREAAPAAPDSAVAATFGLLRAEPDGSVVIAGSGTPGSEIEVYSDDILLGTATVEPSGDWVIVPDAPIIPGGTEITLAEAGKSGRAAQSFVVVINEDKSSEPLVVASTPGAASDVIQGLDRPPVDATTQVAAADPVTPPAPAPVTPPAPAPDPAPAAAASALAPPAPGPTGAKPAPAQPAAAQSSPTPSSTATLPVRPAPPQGEPSPAATPPARTALAAATPAPAATAPAPIAPAPAIPSAPAVAAVTAPVPSPASVAPAQLAVAPTIDAIEIEGDRTFFAGAGTNGSTIRLYVDDSYIADTEVADGRWLIEAGKVLTNPSQRVRIDLLSAGGAEVAARAEVNFEIELPASEPAIAVAEAVPLAQPEPAAAAPATPQPAARADAAQPAAPADAAQPAAPLAQPAPAVAETPAASVPAFPPDADPVPTLVAVSVGGPNSERFASGKAIIRRGDNLWTIARRVYGEGIRYTTIYEANTGQIRDPDQIYPGQVFALPN